jgi:hypothetical protein
VIIDRPGAGRGRRQAVEGAEVDRRVDTVVDVGAARGAVLLAPTILPFLLTSWATAEVPPRVGMAVITPLSQWNA